MNAANSKDIDFEFLSEASPTFTWLCRNFSEPEFETSGNLSDIPLVTIPELESVQNISEVGRSDFQGRDTGTIQEGGGVRRSFILRTGKNT